MSQGDGRARLVSVGGGASDDQSFDILNRIAAEGGAVLDASLPRICQRTTRCLKPSTRRTPDFTRRVSGASSAAQSSTACACRFAAGLL